MKTIHAAAAATAVAALLFPTAAHAASTATILASFADSCRDFEAHSSKDISHVVIHYADGRVVKDEAVTTPDYSLDGAAGDEIDAAVVKSGRTVETFECEAGSAPVALLEWQICQFTLPCRDWTATDSDGGVGNIGHFENPVPLRGINSTDADGDIVSWSISFGDGSPPVSDEWAASPPTEIDHLFPIGCWTVTLTVTDAAGLTGTDQLVVCVIDQRPD